MFVESNNYFLDKVVFVLHCKCIICKKNWFSERSVSLNSLKYLITVYKDVSGYCYDLSRRLIMCEKDSLLNLKIVREVI